MSINIDRLAEKKAETDLVDTCFKFSEMVRIYWGTLSAIQEIVIFHQHEPHLIPGPVRALIDEAFRRTSETIEVQK